MGVELDISTNFGIKVLILYIYEHSLRLTFVTVAKYEVKKKLMLKGSIWCNCFTHDLLMLHYCEVKLHEIHYTLSHFRGIQGKLMCALSRALFYF